MEIQFKELMFQEEVRVKKVLVQQHMIIEKLFSKEEMRRLEKLNRQKSWNISKKDLNRYR